MEMLGISPTLLCGYLEQTGWKEFKTKRTNVKYYQITKKGKDYQADIPLDEKLGDKNLGDKPTGLPVGRATYNKHIIFS